MNSTPANGYAGFWWPRRAAIRTLTEFFLEFAIPLKKPRLYQLIRAQSRQLRATGLSWTKIAEQLGISDKTVKTAAGKQKPWRISAPAFSIQPRCQSFSQVANNAAPLLWPGASNDDPLKKI